MKTLAELKPVVRSLQSRTAIICKAAKDNVPDVLPFLKTRVFASLSYLLIAFFIISSSVINTRLVKIKDDVNPEKYVLTLRTEPKSILTQCGVSLDSDDAYDFSGFKRNFAEIKIYRAFPVTLTADNQTKIIHIARGTVSDALNKSNVSLGTDDLIYPATNQTVSEGMNIRIQRVTYQTVVQSQVISCSLDKQQTPLLKQGSQVVIDPGKNGQNAITTLQKFIDGIKNSEQVIKQEITQRPVSGKILVGTAKSTPVSRLEPGGTVLTSRGAPARYSKCLVGKATAYTAHRNAGTASGRRAAVGVVAVDPGIIPYGTRLYITSSDGSFIYGNAVAGDTGGFTRNGSGVLVDLYFNTMTECCMFGSRNVKIYMLD